MPLIIKYSLISIQKVKKKSVLELIQYGIFFLIIA